MSKLWQHICPWCVRVLCVCVLHSTVRVCTAQYCACVLYSTVRVCTAQYCVCVLHSTVRVCTAQYCACVYCTVLCVCVLHSTVRVCYAQYCACVCTVQYCACVCCTVQRDNFKYFEIFIIILIVSTNHIFVHLLYNKVLYKPTTSLCREENQP